jgi:hypothetical protein
MKFFSKHRNGALSQIGVGAASCDHNQYPAHDKYHSYGYEHDLALRWRTSLANCARDHSRSPDQHCL